jgi:hypothetical protein
MPSNHAGHYTLKCSVCGKVISTCKCPSTDKMVRHELCAECEKLERSHA